MMGRRPNNSVDSSPFKGPSKSASMPFWDDSELRKFFQAYHRHGKHWGKVVKALGFSKTDEDCEVLWRMQKNLLSLPNNKSMEDAFVVVVSDAQEHVNHAGAPRFGPNEANKASDSNHSGSTSSLQATAKRRRTPRARKTIEGQGPSGEASKGGHGSPARIPGYNQATPTHGRKAPGTPTWPNGRPSGAHGSPSAQRNSLVEPPTSGHKRKRHRKLFEDDASPMRVAASACMSPERPGSHNSTLQNVQKRPNPNWPRGPSGQPEQPHEDVGAADALLSLKAMPRATCPPPPSNTNSIQLELEDKRLRQHPQQHRQEEEGESPELKAAGIPGQRLQRKPSTRREPNRPMLMRHNSGDDFLEPGYSTPPTASPSASYPGMAPDRWDSGSGQVTSAIKRIRPTIASSADGFQANSTPGPSSDNAMLTMTMAQMHESAREVNSLAAEPSTASEGAGPSSQLSGGPVPCGHDPMLSARHPYMPPHSILTQPYPLDPGHQHSMSTSAGQPPLGYEAPRRAGPPMPTNSSGRWPQQLQGTNMPVLSARRCQRKPLPEKLPPMVPGLTKLLSRTTLLGTASSFANYGGPGNLGSAFAPQGQNMRQFVLGETGEKIGSVEISLRHSLNLRLRRWCMYEFLYSAIDRPYFMRNEWQEFLQYSGLGGVTKLTRTEWSVIRSGAFGKPRRLSQSFLKSERIRLEAYRETVRVLYENNVGSEFPLNMPKPLFVGQHVTARHPTTRQIHDGVILTVATKGNKYRVQFNRTELMTEMIRDVDVMPVDPNDNLPPAMLPLNTTVNGRLCSSSLGPKRRRTGLAPSRALGRTQLDPQAPAGEIDQPASEAEAALTLEVQQLLNMKEALLQRLKLMNSQAQANHEIRHTHEFQKDYSIVMVQLGQVNDQLKGSLEKLLAQQPHLLGVSSNANTVVPSSDSMPSLQQMPSASPARSSPLGIQPNRPSSDTADTPTTNTMNMQAHGRNGLSPLGDPSTWSGATNTAEVHAIVEHAMREAQQVVGQCTMKTKTEAQAPTMQQHSVDASTQPQIAAQTSIDAPAADFTAEHTQDAGPHLLLEDATTANQEGPMPNGQLSEPSAISRTTSANGSQLLLAEQTTTATAGTTTWPADQSQENKQESLACTPSAIPGATDAATRHAFVEDVITGCVGMLFTVQQCTSSNVPVATMEGALELVLQSLKPRAAANLYVFQEITAAVSTLKLQLANSI